MIGVWLVVMFLSGLSVAVAYRNIKDYLVIVAILIFISTFLIYTKKESAQDTAQKLSAPTSKIVK
jgi:hypothetical protein